MNREITIEHSPNLDEGQPAYFTESGVFSKRHLVEPKPMWSFVERGEWPVFTSVCGSGGEVDPEDVERRTTIPAGTCDRCLNSVAMSFQKGPSGTIQGEA